MVNSAPIDRTLDQRRRLSALSTKQVRILIDLNLSDLLNASSKCRFGVGGIVVSPHLFAQIVVAAFLLEAIEKVVDGGALFFVQRNFGDFEFRTKGDRWRCGFWL